MRRIFSTVLGPHEPALTVGSLAISATVRPPIVPSPVTTPSAPRPSASQLASSASSVNEPSSSSRATRSRTGTLPCWADFCLWRSGPPAKARSKAPVTCWASVIATQTLAIGGRVVAHADDHLVVDAARGERGVAGAVGVGLGRERLAGAEPGGQRGGAEHDQQER